MVELGYVLLSAALIVITVLWRDEKKSSVRALECQEILKRTNNRLGEANKRLILENRKLEKYKGNMVISLQKLIDDGPTEYVRINLSPKPWGEDFKKGLIDGALKNIGKSYL